MAVAKLSIILTISTNNPLFLDPNAILKISFRNTSNEVIRLVEPSYHDYPLSLNIFDKITGEKIPYIGPKCKMRYKHFEISGDAEKNFDIKLLDYDDEAIYDLYPGIFTIQAVYHHPYAPYLEPIISNSIDVEIKEKIHE
jgi:hypothetical protein